MKKIYIIILSVVVMAFASCSKTTYYQVYQTQSTNPDACQLVNGYLVHEDNYVTVQYNFFDENGNAGFWLTNKTDSIVYINLAESFYVVNGAANDYFKAREWTSTKSQTISSSKKEGKRRSNSNKSNEVSIGTSSTSTSATASVERSVVAVPPHAAKYVSEYSIQNNIMELCGVTDTPKRSKSAGLSYTEENSPLRFGNYITYTVGMKGNRKSLSDYFYVSQIINVHEASMFEMVRTKDACGKETGEKVEKMLYSTADRFYVTYKK